MSDFCTEGPPNERKRQWLILFSDPDKGMMIFNDEREAHGAWDRAKDNWTCTLFETSERKFEWRAGELCNIEPPAASTSDAIREECAAIADTIAGKWDEDADIFSKRENYWRANVALNHRNGADECAAAIRATKSKGATS